MDLFLSNKELNKLLKTAGLGSRSELCDEAIIMFLLTTNLRFTDLFKLKVSDIMNIDGSWKDEIKVAKKFGGREPDSVICFLTNEKLRLVLDKYCAVRYRKRHMCTFNTQEYKSLEPTSSLLLSFNGSQFKTQKSKDGHSKHTVQHQKIKKIFLEAKIKCSDIKLTTLCYNTLQHQLALAGYTLNEQISIKMGTLSRLEKNFTSTRIKDIPIAIRKIYSSVKTSQEQLATKNIYHYCCSESFLKIIKDESLWFSDLLKMNDPNEITKNLKLSELISREIMKDNKSYDYLMGESNVGAMRVFACSFSKKSDDLNQWRSYSSDGTGLCIGFNKKKLEGCLALFSGDEEVNQLINGVDSFNVEEINYDDEGTKRSIEQKYRVLWLDYQKSDLNNTLPLDIKDEVQSYIWKTSSIHKSLFYKDEEEVRAFIRAKLDDPGLIKEKKEDNLIKFRNGAYGLTPYIVLNIKAAISEVILGPKCTSSLDDVNFFLKANKIEARVSRSKGEYR